MIMIILYCYANRMWLFKDIQKHVYKVDFVIVEKYLCSLKNNLMTDWLISPITFII